jgi:hypothetical protein
MSDMCADDLPPDGGDDQHSGGGSESLDLPQVDTGLFLLQENQGGAPPPVITASVVDDPFLAPGNFGDEELLTPPAAGGKDATGLHGIAELEQAAQAEHIEAAPALEVSAAAEVVELELSGAIAPELPAEVRQDFTESEMQDPQALELPPSEEAPAPQASEILEVELSMSASTTKVQPLELDLGLDAAFQGLDSPSEGVSLENGEVESAASGIEAVVSSGADPFVGLLSGKSSNEPSAESAEAPLEKLVFGNTDPGKPLANRDTYGAGAALSSPSIPDPFASSEPSISMPAFAAGVAAGPAGPQDLETLRRYAMLKEREALEKDSTIKALQNQGAQMRERLKRSDAERRRLQIALEESESVRRSLEDAREQHKHHLAKLEQVHQEELRSLQLRLDNAQFQASKSERKLEDFRERVRSDIQKIRSRERELGNRLELQKRDAEALLAVKDERLLQQKREIDRLEYELELLQERLVEETEKAEDRISKLHRALQAMRLAQGLLSGLEEEVLPSAASEDDDEGSRAA